MKQNMGISYKFISEEADHLRKLAMKYHILMIATLFYMLRSLFLKGEYELFFDVYTFEMSKVTFSWMMGVMAGMMASCYTMSLINFLVYYKTTVRIYKETAMVYGFLTLMFFSFNLYGFWGVVCLPVYPPMLLLGVQLILYFVKRIKYSGFTRGIIASDAEFWKFSVEYHNALWVTLLLLSLFLGFRGNREFIDFDNFDLSKVSFRQTMGVLTAQMGTTYFAARLISILLKSLCPTERVYEENAMVLGLLTVAFFLMNLFGFWGIMWVLVSPPIILLLLLKVTKRL